MVQLLWRFRASLLPGLGVAVLLIGLAGGLFWVLGDTEISGISSGTPAEHARIISLLKFTLLQASLSTLISLFLGLLLAWSLSHQRRFPGRRWLITLFSASLVLPTLIVALGIITVLGNHGWINRLIAGVIGHGMGGFVYGLSGILIAHVYLNASFAAIGLLHVFESIPPEKHRLARSLGFSPWQRFRAIEWVAVRGSIPRMGATIFLLCFGSFAIVLLLGGSPAHNTLEVAIYEAVRIDFDIPFALRIALIQLTISGVLVAATSRLGTGPANLATPNMLAVGTDSRRWRLLRGSIIALFAFAYLLPLGAIVADGLQADLSRIILRPLLIRSAWMSILIASVSATLTVVLALLLADARRHFGMPLRMPDAPLGHLAAFGITFSGNLYLAIPSLILGLGFFLLAQRLGGSMDRWGIVAVLTANVLMAMPFALSVLIPALQKTARRYDRLVFSLGLNPWQRWRYAEWPYLRPAVRYVFALSFGISLGDLGVIALFGNRNITTLPWYLYQLMGSYRTADAAGVALILLVLVSGVFFVLTLSSDRNHKC